MGWEEPKQIGSEPTQFCSSIYPNHRNVGLCFSKNHTDEQVPGEVGKHVRVFGEGGGIWS